MTSAKKTYLAVSGGLVALGIVLAALGFLVSGFDPNVFTAQIDIRDDSIVLGGVEVDDPTGIFPLEQIARLGEIDVSAPSAPEAPAAPSAPSEGE